MAVKDHKLLYWLAGGLSALSVLLEKKARRGELALYVLPRAGESLWYILVNRRLLPDIKNAEVWIFGGIVTYFNLPLLSLTSTLLKPIPIMPIKIRHISLCRDCSNHLMFTQ